MTYISVRPERFSFEILRKTGEFVINLPTESLARAIDFCGVRSGRDIDKIDACGLSLLPGETVQAPLVAESPVHLECQITQELPLGSHHMFLARISAVRVDEKYMDETGRLCMEKCRLISYIHGTYYTTGRALGKFGFSVQKKKRPRS